MDGKGLALFSKGPLDCSVDNWLASLFANFDDFKCFGERELDSVDRLLTSSQIKAH